MAVCYRHPNRETGVSCSNCGNPICPDCMTATPVGMRCPECSRQRTPVRTLRSMAVEPTVTYVLIGICVLLFIGTAAGGGSFTSGGGGQVFHDLSLYGPAIDGNHEYWRLVTSGFLHAGVIHILFNMYILYWIGTMLEPALGHLRFAALYFASLLCGSFGALLLSADSETVGASGAVFGLMGAAFVLQRLRGIDPMASGIGPIILLNLALTFVIGGISIGGHLGGLIGGAVTAFLMERLGQRSSGVVLPVLACVAVGALAVAGSLAVAGNANAQFGAGAIALFL
jgi:membrane associated rhomboid family serine protease